MNTFSRWAFSGWAFAATAALPLAAQAPQTPPPNDAGKRVHAAWVQEVLDLDVRGAVAAYQTIAQDPPPTQPERWIAIARLAELDRAGVRVQPKPVFADAPAALHEAFATLTPIPVTELLQRASGDPADLLEAAGTDTGRVPALRPATWQVQDWVRSQGMSLVDRLRTRQRIDALNRPRRGSTDPAQWDANDIVDVELRGQHELAANRRSLHFPGWKPPATNGDAAAMLARVRTNLDAWSKAENVTESQRNRLQRLRTGIEQRAATDAAAAIAFVARLPLYAERLLAEPPPNR